MKNNKDDFKSLVLLCASPVGLIALGAVLLLFPDSASILVARILGWVLVAVGILFGASAIAQRDGMVWRVLGAVICLAAGVWLIRDPLALAKGIGRLVGILLAVHGIQDLGLSNVRSERALSIASIVVGVILVLLPMTTSRVVFSLCGLVVLVIGLGMLLERLYRRRQGRDSDIIDAPL